MTQSFNQALELINKSSTILLTMHERMDGDDGGAVLALAHALETLGKKTTQAIKRGVPPQLTFLPKSNTIQDDIEHAQYDLLITCGCATKERTGSDNIFNLTCPVINIDHHPDNTFFGTVNVVNAKKSSVAELIYDLFIHAGWTVTRDIATCLLTGIITDTGSFRHSNTQSSTLSAAARLMQRGALTGRISKETFKNKSPEVLKAWGRVIENSHYDKTRGIIYSVISESDLLEMGPLPASSFEGLTETLNAVPEAKFALLLRQDGNIIKGSLRSGDVHPKNVDVSKIAQLFGGGGHKQAAGFSVAGKLQKDEHGKWKVMSF